MQICDPVSYTHLDVYKRQPAAFACYKTDGDLKKLRGDTAYLNRVLDANIEGYRAIRDAGHAPIPSLPEEAMDVCRIFAGRMLKTRSVDFLSIR